MNCWQQQEAAEVGLSVRKAVYSKLQLFKMKIHLGFEIENFVRNSGIFARVIIFGMQCRHLVQYFVAVLRH